MSDTQEATSGGGSPKDLETLLQLNYLYFTAPHLDTDAYAAFKQQVAPYLANRGADPNEVFSDSVSVTLAQHHFRARPLSAATFAEIDPNKALAFYKERFANAGDFTFVFVGNVKLDELRPLVERYLASLPSTPQRESFKDSGVRPPTGVVEKVIKTCFSCGLPRRCANSWAARTAPAPAERPTGFRFRTTRSTSAMARRPRTSTSCQRACWR
jgi:zinc protease